MPTFSISPANWSDELSIEAAIDAIREAFPMATASYERGSEHANAVLKRLRALNAPESIQAVYTNGASMAVMITLPAAERGHPVEFMMMPDEGIHLSGGNVDAQLANKLAQALGYECAETG